MGSEAAGLEQASGDVVGQIAEPECGAAQVFEPSIECLGRPVAGAGSFEVGEHIGGSLLQGPAQGGELGEPLGTPALRSVISFSMSSRPRCRSSWR